MAKKKHSPKLAAIPRLKRIQELAEDDYRDPSEYTEISESDLHAEAGVTPQTSSEESRDEGALRTMARFEEEERREEEQAEVEEETLAARRMARKGA